uniref:Uncharacterized protein n=1 Tax=Bos indicus x Bos taurus TaxID=30522 RepID=A0A4W2DQD4_BOBOX
YSFSLLSFLGRLGDLASSSCLLVHCFDDTHSDCLSHVTHSKTAQGRIIREALDTHGLARNHINDGSVTRFQEFRAIFQLFPRTTINLLLQLSKLASNVSCVTIQHRCISSTDLAWMVQNNHLSCEASSFHGWIIFAVTSHIATTDIFDNDVDVGLLLSHFGLGLTVVFTTPVSWRQTRCEKGP